MLVPASRIASVRRFNRFYTRQIGVLQSRWLESDFSLTEARILYELSARVRCTATDIVRELGIDHGYLSRILSRFLADKLITRTRSAEDGRQTLLVLTAKGRKAFAPLDSRSQRDVSAMLGKVTPTKQQRVVAAMTEIESIIGEKPAPHGYTLRQHKPGDMGWVVARHGILYGEEYGWNSHIEAITADIVSTFLKNYDPKRERCWIAEIDGEPAGCVFLVKDSDKVARIRLLIVEPHARGLGIGRRLVDECISFARDAGYKSITLWTHSVLTAARAIYEHSGFTMTKHWVHHDFGKPQGSEIWDLVL